MEIWKILNQWFLFGMNLVMDPSTFMGGVIALLGLMVIVGITVIAIILPFAGVVVRYMNPLKKEIKEEKSSRYLYDKHMR